VAIAISIRACLAGQRVQVATATQWVARLAEHKRRGTLETELRRLGFIPLIVVDLCRYRDYAETDLGPVVNARDPRGFRVLAFAELSA
jgi:hypothetical protein